jgi:hypothetical protein
MKFIADHLDAILTAATFLVAVLGYCMGRMSASYEITATLKEIDQLRTVIYEIKTSQHLSTGNHPAGIRLVRE